jgi:ectoine hydroxylase-related dioxygenase (phytanoyl-CoA dioxygenase family)
MSIRELTRDLLALPALLVLGAVHILTGRTPALAYQGMIRLFLLTGGWSNDALASMIRVFRRPASLPAPVGILGSLTPMGVEEVAREIRERGFCVFEEQIPAAMVQRLLQFSLTTECRTRPKSGDRNAPGEAASGKYDRANPVAVRYDYDPQAVVNNPDVQCLMADASLLSVVQAYLGSLPIADVTSMWWNTAYSMEADEDAAQLFHFDMDRVRWIKVFIYLTDVTTENGPHCFIEGSHRTGGIPSRLLSKGYTRIDDEEVSRYYTADKFVEFKAQAGTIILEDTRGLHKGLAVRKGDRLMLQLQFSNSLFGARYPRSTFRSMTAELRSMAEAYPAIYGNYSEIS